ncbi:hypothetical protein ABFT80_26290 [Mesorhizobium sp. SB112]|uniref:hypothetical protein n=1 Tax=Mesorhizobium sp. SB112 TaxID=3151853 RepID=UPI00326316EE
METPTLTAAHCAIERLRDGNVHRVMWVKGETPEALARLFTTIMKLHKTDPL